MSIQWHADLATGNSEIDGHHKEILNKINELIGACKEGREKTVVIELLAFLNRYVDSYFVVEEGFLERNGSPNIQEHLRQHFRLREDLKTLITQCAHEGVTLGVVANTLKLTYLWLRDHIQLMDKELILADDSNK
jgi:hemerythrin